MVPVQIELLRPTGHPSVDQLTSAVMGDEEDIQCPKPEGLNRKQVAGPYLAAVLGQELSPAWGGCPVVGTPHVPGDRARTDLAAKTRQFCLDSALSPDRILTSHATNECSELGVSFPAPRFLRPG